MEGKRARRREGLRRWEVALLLGLALAALFGSWLEGQQNALEDQVIRLHVVANSDSAADQALKLQVRDAVLEKSAVYTAGLDQKEAAQALAAALPQLGQAAADTVAREGYDYPVRVSIGKESFPTRSYDSFALPAGTYTALRVELGEGRGKNWWCVVFPPLCTQSVTEPLGAGELTEDQIALITGAGEKYVIRFQAIALWENVKRSLSR